MYRVKKAARTEKKGRGEKIRTWENDGQSSETRKIHYINQNSTYML